MHAGRHHHGGTTTTTTLPFVRCCWVGHDDVCKKARAARPVRAASVRPECLIHTNYANERKRVIVATPVLYWDSTLLAAVGLYRVH